MYKKHETGYLERSEIRLLYTGFPAPYFIKKKGAGQIMTKVKRTSVAPEQFVLRRRIGSTNYRVRVCFNPNSKERIEEKMLRLLEKSCKNSLKGTTENDTITMLQIGRLPEGSSQ